MYSSLQRMDITTQGERGIIAVQTDHRSPEEMEEQREISTIFALTRVLNPLRAEGQECEAVKHVGAHPPADFMAHALRCAGAHIEIEGRDPITPEPDAEEVNRLFNIAMEDLARATVEAHGLSFDETAVEELQGQERQAGGPRGPARPRGGGHRVSLRG